MQSLLSNLKVFFTNRIGMVLVLSNLIIAISGLRNKDWNFSNFHFYYEPTEIKFLSLINFPAIIFGQFVYDLMNIRNVNPEDAAQVAEIYNYYIQNTHQTFETEPLSAEDMRARIEEIREDYPYLVAEENGEIYGYAFATQF